ncbi:valine--pyruvate transaminase [Saccharobesus litoralis]|uniref:Valine--pyruvate transaminase n=1 Tax=Saccharobesus litoralis TaxID=2172099 RepID=A0A2S0VRS4_9ALTE|nr:valine--pyruvate transaminase [Saccharobesus litoralis]AWB66909.1 valine--pyruvate transaminase [Saccharobesus litoralis]
MKLSQFGQQLTSDSGIVNLMADLGNALNVNPNLLFLGGGNPAKVDEFELLVSQLLSEIAQDPQALHKLVGVYQSPQGAEDFIQQLSHYFQQHCAWQVADKNIAITNGSQSAFFILINMLAGQAADATQHKHFLFPLMPEYLGYSDQGVADDYFVGAKPQIEEIGPDLFKYKIDFDNLHIDDKVAAICVSRPTNPTGNMITDDELNQLSDLAKQHNIPLIIDCAYGEPFPGIVYQSSNYQWQDHHILVLSLSKLGLPATRTGIVVAHPDLIQRVVKVNTIMSLANGNLGPELMTRMLAQGKVKSICKDMLLPFYQRKRDVLMNALRNELQGLPYRIHQPEGAFFLWLWLKDLPISSADLYQRLKQQGVLVMDGSPFFFALDDAWQHKQECLRLSYCQSDEVIESAAKIIGQEVKALYSKQA